MVGGEYSTENDSTKGSARALVSKPLALSVAKKQRWDIFVLDKRFALIDEYITAKRDWGNVYRTLTDFVFMHGSRFRLTRFRNDSHFL
jgi:hypothetical protein